MVETREEPGGEWIPTTAVGCWLRWLPANHGRIGIPRFRSQGVDEKLLAPWPPERRDVTPAPPEDASLPARAAHPHVDSSSGKPTPSLQRETETRGPRTLLGKVLTAVRLRAASQHDMVCLKPTVRHGATIFRDTARQSSLAAHGPSLKVVRQSATRRILNRLSLRVSNDNAHCCVPSSYNIIINIDVSPPYRKIFGSGEGVRLFCIPSGRLASYKTHGCLCCSIM